MPFGTAMTVDPGIDGINTVSLRTLPAQIKISCAHVKKTTSVEDQAKTPETEPLLGCAAATRDNEAKSCDRDG